MTTFALVAVFDKVAETYGRPFCAANRPAAVRSFAAEVNNPQSGMLHDRPEDFRLVYFGTFNDQDGFFDVGDNLTPVLAEGVEVKAKPAEPSV